MNEEIRYREVTPKELQVLQRDAGTVVLDVLPPDRFERCRIPGAVNACVYQVVFSELVAVAAPDKDATVVVCGAAGESGRDEAALDAAGKLERLGYADVRVLPGGVRAWVDAGLPPEGSAPETLEDFGAPSLPPDGEYPVLPEESVVRWLGRNANNEHVGSVSLADGMLRVRGGRLAGNVVVDMRSLKNENLTDPDLRAMLLAHLASDDFFWTERFPEAVFELAGDVVPDSTYAAQPNVDLRGKFSLRGMTRELVVPATVAALGSDRLAIEAHFDLDRTLWGAKYGSGRLYRFLGMHLVYDKVGIQLRLVAGAPAPKDGS